MKQETEAVTYQGLAAVPRKPRRWLARARTVVLALASACALSAGAFWGYLRWGDINPEIHIPPQVLPKVNAYDTWERAWAAIKDEKSIINFFEPAVLAATGESSVGGRVRADYVTRNREALALLRQGLLQEYVRPNVPIDLDEMNDGGHQRQLARIMTMEAGAYDAAGQAGHALETALDMLQMGAMVARGNGTIGRMVGMAIQNFGRFHLWRLVDRVDRAAATSAVKRLEAITSTHLPLSETLRHEMYDGQSEIMKILQKRAWRDELRKTYFEIEGVMSYLSSIPFLKGGDFLSRLGLSKGIYYGAKRELMGEYVQEMERQIADADKLPPPQTDADADVPNPYVRMFVMNNGLRRFLEAKNTLVPNRLLIVKYALRAYFLDHNEYPQDLSVLVPQYLSSLPRDPFRPEQTFCYKRTPMGYLLYSVGPDRLDQGGAPIKNSTESLRKYPPLLIESVGDVVAGANPTL